MANVTLFQNRNSLFVKLKFPVLKDQGIGPQAFVFQKKWPSCYNESRRAGGDQAVAARGE